ncbi:MAG: hypothetical protein KGH98_00535 [Candidatus Micrarchaeota archaeon]|nr:hypothetical protein [Candidatus Micrarchaeota archaeon]
MSGFRWAPFALLAITFLSLTGISSSALFWFQTGVRGSSISAFNNGASVSIQTIEPQPQTNASLGFWVGEDLSNGAFLQVGYEIPNYTASYPNNCDPSGCSTLDPLTAGNATWFWEYFPAGYNGQAFYGMLGPDGSAGKNGTFNTYSFSSNGNMWSFFVNGKPIGSVDLGTSSSGSNPPVAFGEDAGDTTNTTFIRPVPFRNFQFLSATGRLLQVPEGLAYTGYGAISDTFLKNPYGVTEVYPYVNYFLVGSGISSPVNDTVLWNIGYRLRVSSQYASIAGSENYSALSSVMIAAPKYANVSDGERAVFVGWQGTGAGSYSGPLNQTRVQMYSNITETALWKVQYYINATSGYSSVEGGGWVDANKTDNISISEPVVGLGNGTRVVFSGWSDGQDANAIHVRASSPIGLQAEWDTQYYLNATSEYGNAMGSGWYGPNSTATVSVDSPMVQLNSTTRAVFYSWDGKYLNATQRVVVSGPESIAAKYRKEYLTTLSAINAYNQSIKASFFYVDGIRTAGSLYLGGNETHNVEYLAYKGANVTTDFRFTIGAPQVVYVRTPIYDVAIHTNDFFGRPVNASVKLTFKNGTVLESFTGSNGTMTIGNVPYGYVNGSANYFGMAQRVSAANGGNVYLTFLNTGVVVAVLVGILIIVLCAVFAGWLWGIRRR